MENKEQQILQKHLSQFLIKEVFNTITEEDILKIKAPNVWEHKGQKLTEGQVLALRNQAETFKDSTLWKILKAELLWLAHSYGYVKSKTEADQIAGKMIEYLCNAIDSRLKTMSE